MRLSLVSVSAASLLCALLAAGGASAQSGPGWVDPPARAAVPDAAPREARPPRDVKAPRNVNPPREAAPPQAAAPEAPEADEAAAPPRRRAERSRPSRAAARQERRARGLHRAPRRLADTPAPVPTPAPMAPRQAEGRVADWAGAAQRFVDDYLDSVSAPGDVMVGSTPSLYAERVRFHGRTLSLAAIMAEKRRFVRRWPERRYAVQPGTTRTACNAALATCMVYAVFDFRAGNPATGARSQGVSELALELSFAGGRPVIVSERSRVLRRDGAVGALARPARSAESGLPSSGRGSPLYPPMIA
ncbi:hypothetical protein [Methylobacterium nigriterrae]|uniref:hypothetical protein n=1 Tax=Methylobacterium nigriterrae TaxID=3127512 RepID=UPI00301333AC